MRQPEAAGELNDDCGCGKACVSDHHRTRSGGNDAHIAASVRKLHEEGDPKPRAQQQGGREDMDPFKPQVRHYRRSERIHSTASAGSTTRFFARPPSGSSQRAGSNSPNASV